MRRDVLVYTARGHLGGGGAGEHATVLKFEGLSMPMLISPRFLVILFHGAGAAVSAQWPLLAHVMVEEVEENV